MEQHIKADSVSLSCYLQVQTGYEDSSLNTAYCVSPQYADGYDLWSSPSCSDLLADNTCVELGTIENNFIYWQPECQFDSFPNPASSDNQLPPDDIILCTDSLLQPKQFKNSIMPSVNSGSAFEDWKSYRPPMGSLQPRKSQSLHKRCVRFLNCINNHKISPLLTDNGGISGININNKTYDKLSIHHVVAERKRREKMKETISDLRALLPMYPKKSKATVLLQTIDYINHLKRRVDQLEKRNAELEALHRENSLHSHDSH